jgi:D-xylose transport system substrate-binding protein
MITRKLTTVAFAAMLVAAACGGGAASPSAGTSTAPTTAPASEGASPSSAATDCVVGVSWNNFQQPRWAATDKPSMQKVIEAGGGKFIDKDANLNNEQQLSDVDTLISQGAKVLVLLAQDNKAILPALKKAQDAGIPVIAYDRLIEDPGVLYLSFNNVAVGEAEATAIMNKVPKGNYVVIKGDPGDPNAATFLRGGYDNVGLKDKVASGDITILDEQFTPGWKTETAQSTMEAIIDKAKADGKTIDAVLAENDSTALGVAAALKAKNYDPYPPLSGQDGDPANLNNVAKGLQYVDVWKNSNELGKAAGEAALQLCAGKKISEIALTGSYDPTVAPKDGLAVKDFTTPNGTVVKSMLFTPTPITAADMQKVFDAGWWATKEVVCKDADTTLTPACK